MKYRMVKMMLLVALVTTTAVGCLSLPGSHNLPPAQRLMEPGPGVGGPGPGVMMQGPPMGAMGIGAQAQTSQLHILGKQGMTVLWDVSEPGAFDSPPHICPLRQNFTQGQIYRMKLTKIPGRPGVELYPSIEVAPQNSRTAAFLAHNPIPVQFTEEDLDQVLSGNFVTKVIYVPDPEFQELADAKIDTLISTRLDPGQDPIAVADQRGSILAIVRIGNIDLGIPGGDAAERIMPAGFVPAGQAMMTPVGYGRNVAMAAGGAPLSSMPSPISGINTPAYGIPMSGTPIGLPGPPHIPFGIQPGLKKHVIENHTRYNIPGPTKKIHIDVKQRPGFSYPKPASRVRITETHHGVAPSYHNPLFNRLQMVK